MDYDGLLWIIRINYCGLLWVIPTFLTKRKKNHTLKNNELHCFGRAKVLAQVLFEHGLVLLPSLATREPGISGRGKSFGIARMIPGFIFTEGIRSPGDTEQIASNMLQNQLRSTF